MMIVRPPGHHLASASFDCVLGARVDGGGSHRRGSGFAGRRGSRGLSRGAVAARRRRSGPARPHSRVIALGQAADELVRLGAARRLLDLRARRPRARVGDCSSARSSRRGRDHRGQRDRAPQRADLDLAHVAPSIRMRPRSGRRGAARASRASSCPSRWPRRAPRRAGGDREVDVGKRVGLRSVVAQETPSKRISPEPGGSGGAPASERSSGWRSRIWKMRLPEAAARWAIVSEMPSVCIGLSSIKR